MKMKQYRMEYRLETGEIDGRLFFAWDQHDANNQAESWIYTYNETWGENIILVSVKLA